MLCIKNHVYHVISRTSIEKMGISNNRKVIQQFRVAIVKAPFPNHSSRFPKSSKLWSKILALKPLQHSADPPFFGNPL